MNNKTERTLSIIKPDAVERNLESEIKNLDLFDKNENTITLIEWPELINKGNFKKTIDLIFNYENELINRSIKIDGLD